MRSPVIAGQLALPLAAFAGNRPARSPATRPGRIKTGSWFGPLPEGHTRIGISRGRPRFAKADSYRLFPQLNPGPWFKSVSDQEYLQRYQAEVLDLLDPRQTAAELIALADSKVPVLCCFERVGGPGWCHRSLVAAWLAEALGEPVPELGHEELPQDRHPLLPPTVDFVQKMGQFGTKSHCNSAL